MAKIAITDRTGVIADLTVRDDSPFAKGRATKVVLAAASLAGDFASPIDQINFSKATFGASFAEPSLLLDGPSPVSINAGASGMLSVLKPADKTLFGDDGVSPAIPIADDECWIGVEIDGTLAGAVSAAANGFGVGAAGSGAVSFATYSVVKAKGASFPQLKDCLGKAFENYSLVNSAGALRKQAAGTVSVTNIGGTLTFTGSYSLPVSVNALASANLPFNYKIDVTPSASLEVSGKIAVSGNFEMRLHKVSDTELRLGAYKKKGTTLSAAVTAGAGIEADHMGTDLLTSVLGAAFGKGQAESSGIEPGDAAALGGVLQESVNRNVSIALNLSCSASKANEAAALYSIDLSGGDAAQTDAALNAALRGDWTELGRLPNARTLRNVVNETHQSQHKVAINLLGVYNATSVADFVRSCTILHDESGAVLITDKSSASRISAVQNLYAADPDKLRSALADAFLATVTYSAAAGGGIKTAISASQTYFFYKQNLTRQQMNDALLLGDQLGVLELADWRETLAANSRFGHVRVSVSARYDSNAALRLFFADPGSRSLRSPAELERIGRTTMLALIDPESPAGEIRRSVLANDGIWSAMNEAGAVASFRTLPGLTNLRPTEVGVVGADWVDVRWWADSMVAIGKQLGGLISAVESAGGADPTADANFRRNREKVAAGLADVTRKAHAAFVGGWGLAVMFALSRAAVLTMDIGWEGDSRHYETTGAKTSQAPGTAQK